MNTLYLWHGRNSIDEDMQDWGFDGPVIKNIDSIHFTYGEMRIYFKSEEDKNIAQKQTGWSSGYDNNDLEIMYSKDGDLIMTCIDNQVKFYGDFDLIQE